MDPRPASLTDLAVAASGLSKVYGLSPAAAVRALQEDDPAAAVTRAGGHLAVHDVNVAVDRGEMFIIMGLSGSGKSTLIRMFNRLTEPTAGQVIIDGDNIAELPEARLRELRNRKAGMVFQHFSLFPHWRIRDNAAYGLKLRGIGKAERLERADQALHRVGLGNRADAYPHELSGGMKQRVGLARALACDPPILLMDEPFSALDPLIRRDMQDLLLQLQAEDSRTIIFVTHDLNEAMRLGDRILIMRDGRVVQVGAGAEIIVAPADDYVSRFVSDVDRGRVLTAGDLLRPPLLCFGEGEDPRAALAAMGDNEANGAFVLDDTGRLLGVVSDSVLVKAIGAGADGLAGAVTRDYHAVTGDAVIADFIQYAGRHLVPVTVVDSDGRLAGVVPRAVILSALSGSVLAGTAGVSNA
jgi:glycine betaine/proline transport system ATP-binding protein